jgi:hypothetical protein
MKSLLPETIILQYWLSNRYLINRNKTTHKCGITSKREGKYTITVTKVHEIFNCYSNYKGVIAFKYIGENVLQVLSLSV